MTKDGCILRIENLTKDFPGVRALDEVSLDITRGEVHGLLGENGAGKSTLIKIIAGIYRPDGGDLIFDEEPCRFSSPAESFRKGIAVIHQETSLIPCFTVLANVFLGIEELKPGGILSEKRMLERYAELNRRFGLSIDPQKMVRDLSVAEQKLTEIMKALLHESSFIIMDEPTDSLTEKEIEKLFLIIAELKKKGITILYITHYLDEVFTIADKATVLKDGRRVLSQSVADLTKDDIVRSMVGETLAKGKRAASHSELREVLSVEELTSRTGLNGVSFKARAGEILGITGLIGSGKTECARVLFGADRASGGRILVRGKECVIRSPKSAVRHRIGMLPEDRKSQGLVLEMEVYKNLTLASLGKYASLGVLRKRLETSASESLVSRLGIKIAGLDQRVKFLSGGNQQKVIIAKWIASGTDIIIMDEPTRGIDIGAKQAVYGIMRGLADEGKCVIFISSEVPEVLEVSDRIIVMKNGRADCEYRCGVTQKEVMAKILEVEHESDRG